MPIYRRYKLRLAPTPKSLQSTVNCEKGNQQRQGSKVKARIKAGEEYVIESVWSDVYSDIPVVWGFVPSMLA